MITQFISRFTEKKLDFLKIGNKFYHADPSLVKISRREKKEPYSIGMFLGQKKDGFVPSLPLLEWLSKNSEKKIFINEKAAWLFLCGRDALEQSIIKKNIQSGLVLVQNENDENLGYGIYQDNMVKLMEEIRDIERFDEIIGKEPLRQGRLPKEGKMIRICPKCKSKDVGMDTSFAAENQYKCYKCGFTGMFFPEVDEKEMEK